MIATAEASAKSKRSYDPGTPQCARKIRDGIFEVGSFRVGTITYRVDTRHHTCDCPHFEYRIARARKEGQDVDDCKHLVFAAEYERCLDFATRFSVIEKENDLPLLPAHPADDFDPFADDFDPFADDFDPFEGMFPEAA